MTYATLSRPTDGVGVVTLDREERLNSLSFDLVVPLIERLDEAIQDRSIECIILTGKGRAFCSGADVQDSEPPPDIDGLTMNQIATKAMDMLVGLIRTMRHAPKPVIAAINGPAIGGGLCLALGTDIRLAAESAYFRAAGINNGLTALELGLSYTLPRAVGTTRAFEMALTGRDVPADEAAHMGLISRAVPDDQLMDEAIAMARQILGWSTNGVVHTKRLLWAGLESGSIENAFELESTAQLFMRMTTENFEEAMRARKEGRSPTFND